MIRTLLTIALSLPLVALSPVVAGASEHEDTTAQDALAETAKQLNNPISSVWNLSLIHISEPTRLRRISYAVFCLKKKK